MPPTGVRTSSMADRSLHVDVRVGARRAGFDEDAVARAPRRIGVVKEDKGYPRRTVWSLPEEVGS